MGTQEGGESSSSPQHKKTNKNRFQSARVNAKPAGQENRRVKQISPCHNQKLYQQKTKKSKSTFNSMQPEPHTNQRTSSQLQELQKADKEMQHVVSPALAAERIRRQMPKPLPPPATKLESRTSQPSIPKTTFGSSHAPDPQRASSRKPGDPLRALGPRHWAGASPQSPGFKASTWQSCT